MLTEGQKDKGNQDKEVLVEGHQEAMFLRVFVSPCLSWT